VRRMLAFTAAAGLISGLWLLDGVQAGGLKATSPNAVAKKKVVRPAVPSDETCSGDHGTAIEFEASPSDAARKALKEEKLVLVLHISGHFENPDFT
jgi:hypothetical protein